MKINIILKFEKKYKFIHFSLFKKHEINEQINIKHISLLKYKNIMKNIYFLSILYEQKYNGYFKYFV